MAYTKVIAIHCRLDNCINYTTDPEKTQPDKTPSLANVIDYAMNLEKSEQTCFQEAVNCNLHSAYADMMVTKHRWGKAGENHVQGYHIIQSFAPGEVTPDQANALGMEFANRLLGSRYEVVVSTHLNKAHLHNHIVFNSVSFMDGRMHRNNFRDYYGGDGVGIRGTSDAICLEHGLSVIEPSEKPHRAYTEWSAEQQDTPTIRGTVRQEVDRLLAQSFTYKSFLLALQRDGYEIKSGKHLAVKPPGCQRFIRLKSLGEDYTEDAIKARLSGQRTGPEPSTEPPQEMRLNLRRIPPKKYHIKSAPAVYRRRAHGFRLLYLKYLYLLGAVPNRRPRRAVPLAELRKLDRYQRQFLYLRRSRIDTADQLSMQYDALQAKIDALTERRASLYQVRREYPSEQLNAEIAEITQVLRPLRRDLKLCAAIEGDLPRIHQQVQAEQKEQEIEKEVNQHGRKRSR